jgi:hypothetical protein
MQLYLNNSGSRWINTTDNKGTRDKVKLEIDGKVVRSYAVKYWEAVGNFAVPVIIIRKKTLRLVTSNKIEGAWTTYDNKYPYYQDSIKNFANII